MKVSLMLWLLVVASLSHVSALTLSPPETRAGGKSPTFPEQPQTEPSQTLEPRLETATCTYEFAPESLLAANAGARFSRVGGAAGDFLIPGEATLQAGLRDPALYGTRLTTAPTFDPALDSLGRVTGRGLNASVDIGPGAFSSRGNLIQTIIHEEAHIRLDLRAAQGRQRAIGIQSTLTAEEAYVEAVAQRFWQRYRGR